MRWLKILVSRVRGSFRCTGLDDDLRQEINDHVEEATAEYVRRGFSAAEARRAALISMGAIERHLEDFRDLRGFGLVRDIGRDLRLAARMMRRHPGFTAVIVATLALGIGATTALFMVADAIVWTPLPYASTDRLVAISEVDRRAPSTGANVASADWVEWQRQATMFSGLASYDGVDEHGLSRVDLSLAGGTPSLLKGLSVTSNLFDVLGVAPALGRSFVSDDQDDVAILSYPCWQTKFGANPGIVGQTIPLDGQPRAVIGVLPRGFFFPNKDVEVFLPTGRFTPDRTFYDAGVVARLRPDVTLAQARAEMATIGERLQHAYPATNATLDPRVEPWQSMLSTSRRPALIVLSAAAVVLFLIVCSNVAHLQLGRAASRQQEFSIRLGLGAGRARLVRQLLTESVALSGLGGLLGFAVATIIRVLLLRFAPDAIPLYSEVRIDLGAVAFAAGATLVAAVIFGVGPAWSASRPEYLRLRGSTAQPTDRWVRSALLVGEVGFSVVLVVGATLFVRSLIRLDNVDLGFRADHALTFRVDLGPSVPAADQRSRQYDEIENGLLHQRGISAAGATSRPLLGGGAGGEATVTIRGRQQALRLEVATPGYFRALQTRLLSGRLPSDRDAKEGPLVVVVNAAFARRYFADVSPVGQRITLGRRGAATIVGVVADLKQEAVDQPAQPAAFGLAGQLVPRAMTFVVRGQGNPDALTTVARDVVHAVNPQLPLARIAMLDELVQASVSGQRLRAWLLSLVAGAALLLAAIGLYGVSSQAVTRRTGEIGLRMALGASAPDLFGMILLDGVRPVLIGSTLGCLGAFATGRVVGALLFETSVTALSTYVVTLALLVIVSIIACAIPASRAIHVDPVAALRGQ